MKKQTICEDCGTSEGRIINSIKHGKTLCRNCYQTRALYGNFKFHDLPPSGVIVYNDEGNPICHICGRAYKKLMGHVRQKHDMTAYEYKKEFGLNTTHSVMCKSSVELARKHNLENYDTVVTKNLIACGKQTRFTKGSHGRQRAMLSLQELYRIRIMNRQR
jgi:hypothetical protein